jgi:hypothetical protein
MSDQPLLSKSEYAARLYLSPAAVSAWAARQKLTLPELRPDGLIDVSHADARGRPRGAKDRAGSRAAAKAMGAIVAQPELPGLAQVPHLDRGQVSALNRWFAGRRTHSERRRPAPRQGSAGDGPSPSSTRRQRTAAPEHPGQVSSRNLKVFRALPSPKPARCCATAPSPTQRARWPRVCGRLAPSEPSITRRRGSV